MSMPSPDPTSTATTFVIVPAPMNMMGPSPLRKVLPERALLG